MSFFNQRALVFLDLGSGCGRAFAFIFFGVLASCEWSGGSAVLADEWPQWLGPQRDGAWAAEGIPEKFPSEGPKLLWKQTIGGGYSGPAVSTGCVVVMDRRPAPVTGSEKFLHKEDEIPRNENFVRQLRPGKELSLIHI